MSETKARDAVAANVSRETLEKLDLYARLLKKWQPTINLISPKTLDTLWQRHIRDSAQVMDANTQASGLWLDIGSGGGFPGMVCAMIAQENYPGLSFRLVEADQRKATFLREVARQTGCSVTVQASRVEALEPQNASVISARALAPLPTLLSYAAPHLIPGGICLFQKGAQHMEELASAKADWQMHYDVYRSQTDDDAVILRLSELFHATR